MTLTEYRRWQLFSGRLAQHARPRMTEARKTKLREAVLQCIDVIRSNGGLDQLVDWDSPPYICDSVKDSLFDWGYLSDDKRTGELRGDFGLLAMACIRAGLDVASEPSAGVVGFDVGTLRRMFPRGLPMWLQLFFETPITEETQNSEEVWL